MIYSDTSITINNQEILVFFSNNNININNITYNNARVQHNIDSLKNPTRYSNCFFFISQESIKQKKYFNRERKLFEYFFLS